MWQVKTFATADDGKDYESGGILSYAEGAPKGDIAITTKGDGILKITEGLKKESSSEETTTSSVRYYLCNAENNVAIVRAEELDDTSNQLTYELTRGLEYDSATLTYPLENAVGISLGNSNDAEQDEEKVIYTKNWMVTVTNDGNVTSTIAPECEGKLKYPQSGEVVLTTSGKGDLNFTIGAEENKTFQQEEIRAFTFTPTNATTFSYTLSDNLKTESIHYAYNKITAAVTIPSLGTPTSSQLETSGNRKSLILSKNMVISDPAIMALAAEVQALEATQTDSSSHEEKINALKKKQENLKLELGTESKDKATGLIKTNKDLQKEYNELAETYDGLINERNESAKQEKTLTSTKTELQQQIDKLENEKKNLQTQINALDDEELQARRNYANDIIRKLTMMEALFGVDVASELSRNAFEEILHTTRVNGKNAVNTEMTSVNIANEILTLNMDVHISSQFSSERDKKQPETSGSDVNASGE